MLKRAVLICSLLAAVPLLSAQARQPKPTTKPPPRDVQRNGAEAVFASAASKVVFVITRKSGQPRASASGVILSADGYIATNYHALQGADAVELRFFPDPTNSEDYQSFNAAKLLYADEKRDIAILKVAATSLPFLECPSPGSKPRVGETVYAIGNPKGLSNTISEGIVSGLRSVDKEDFIQHTAAISPGSSGGALVDSDGGLLGMNSWRVADADAQNLNFAISAEYLSQALTAARQSTIARSFPPDVPAPVREPVSTVNPSMASGTGTYYGKVHSSTSQLSADFEVQVRQGKEHSLSGCVIVHRPLYGSGELHGEVKRSQVTFAVSSWLGVITFSGQQEGDNLAGAYSVRQKNGRRTQEGTFELRRQSKTLPINFNPKNCRDDSVIR